jgi:outer membrane lipoprotein LolB
VCFLSACSTFPTAQLHGSEQVRPYQEHLQLAGRLSVQYQKNDKPQFVNGSFEWKQDGAQLQIRLLSPLGQTIADIQSSPAGASLQQAEQPLKQAPHIDQLISAELGWPLPVADMQDWLQGFVRNQAGQREMLAAKDLQIATPDGWNIRYVSWQENSQQAYPKRIDLQRYNEQFGQIQVRITLDEWTIL